MKKGTVINSDSVGIFVFSLAVMTAIIYNYGRNETKSAFGSSMACSSDSITDGAQAKDFGDMLRIEALLSKRGVVLYLFLRGDNASET